MIEMVGLGLVEAARVVQADLRDRHNEVRRIIAAQVRAALLRVCRDDPIPKPPVHQRPHDRKHRPRPVGSVVYPQPNSEQLNKQKLDYWRRRGGKRPYLVRRRNPVGNRRVRSVRRQVRGPRPASRDGPTPKLLALHLAVLRAGHRRRLVDRLRVRVRAARRRLAPPVLHNSKLRTRAAARHAALRHVARVKRRGNRRPRDACTAGLYQQDQILLQWCAVAALHRHALPNSKLRIIAAQAAYLQVAKIDLVKGRPSTGLW